MFTDTRLPARRVRARSVGLAALAAVCATAVVSAPAWATTAAPPVGDAVIASAGGTTIDTTSGSNITVDRTESRPAASGSLTLNSADPTETNATKPATTRATGARQISAPSLESPTIVESTPRHVAAQSRTALAQLQSGGPIIASSGTASVATHARRHATRPVLSPAYVPSRVHIYGGRPATPAASTTVDINAPGVHVFISQTAARRPSADTRTSAPERWIGPATFALAGFAGLLPNSPRPAPAPASPSNSTLFGSGTGSAGVSLLLGIDGLFAIAALLVGVAWRRRSWDLPVLARQSALLCLALDRPG